MVDTFGAHRIGVIVLYHPLVVETRFPKINFENVQRYLDDIDLQTTVNEYFGSMPARVVEEMSGSQFVKEACNFMNDTIWRYNKEMKSRMIDRYYLWMDHIDFAHADCSVPYLDLSQPPIVNHIMNQIVQNAPSQDTVSIVFCFIDIFIAGEPICYLVM